jgi:hypothetical protein
MDADGTHLRHVTHTRNFETRADWGPCKLQECSLTVGRQEPATTACAEWPESGQLEGEAVALRSASLSRRYRVARTDR